MSGVEHSAVRTVVSVGDYIGINERRGLGSEILIELFYGSPQCVPENTTTPATRLRRITALIMTSQQFS